MTSRNSSNIRSFYGPLLMSRQVGMNSGTSLSYKLQQLLHLLRSPHRETWTRLGLLLVLRLAGSLEASRSLSSLFCRLITCRTYYQISFVSSFYPLPRTNHLTSSSLRDLPFSDGGFSEGAVLFSSPTRTLAKSKLVEELTRKWMPFLL